MQFSPRILVILYLCHAFFGSSYANDQYLFSPIIGISKVGTTEVPTQYFIPPSGKVAFSAPVIIGSPLTTILSREKNDIFKKITLASSLDDFLASFYPKTTPEIPQKSAKKTPAKSAIAKCGVSPFSVAQIKELVTATAQEYGVDTRFALAIVEVESHFDRNRNSHAGARGPMQLMPATAQRFGVQDICDPQQNITGGITYLKWLLDTFQNPLYAAAAYNAFMNTVAFHHFPKPSIMLRKLYRYSSV